MRKSIDDDNVITDSMAKALAEATIIISTELGIAVERLLNEIGQRRDQRNEHKPSQSDQGKMPGLLCRSNCRG